jgi:hypothetical protein
MEYNEKGFLEKMKCPACLEYIIPPIPLCQNGHILCHICRQRLYRCPVCRYPFSKTRCLILENIAKSINYPCKYHDDGCTKALNLGLIKSHEEECLYRPLKCPFSSVALENCLWEGQPSNIKSHVLKYHNSTSISAVGDHEHYSTLTFPKKSVMKWYRAIFTMGQTFFSLCRVIENEMHFCVFYVGPWINASNYSYKVTMEKLDKSGSFSICSRTKYYLSDAQNIFRNQNCAVFPGHFWKKCLDANDHLEYKMEVFEGSHTFME